MNRKIKLGYVFLSLVIATVLSCSSDKKQDENVSPDVAEATSDAGAPIDPNAAPVDASAAPADTSAQPPADPNAPPLPTDASAAAPTDPNAPPGEPGKVPETTEGEMAAADSAAGTPPADPGAAPGAPGETAAPVAPPADTSASTPPPADTPTTTASNDTGSSSGQSGDLFGAGGGDAGGEAPAPKKNLPLAHVKDAPFTRGGQNLNTVYIAREGDTLESISQKLFGEDKTKQLKKGNPTLKKSVKTGDKVYFNSPNRPDDKDKMLTVYEDQGLEGTHYTTKDGDTLKSLAQDWYGSENSYKEIYAVNRGLSSTKELPAGTDLIYWPATAAVAVYGAKKDAEVAQNAPPPDANAANNNAPPPPPAGNPPDQANNNNPPGGAGTVQPPIPPPPANLPPPPPPPDLNAANNMPPPIAAPPKKHHEPANALGGMDKDTIMYAAAAGIFLIGGGLLVAIRRRNARRNSGITQV